MEEIKLQIQYALDREAVVKALANSGYSVRVVEEERYPRGTDYYVVLQIDSLKDK